MESLKQEHLICTGNTVTGGMHTIAHEFYLAVSCKTNKHTFDSEQLALLTVRCGHDTVRGAGAAFV